MSDKYLIDNSKLLGRGATACVYVGIRKEDGELCALKCSHQQLKKEISISRDLDHRNIVKFYESFSDLLGFREVLVMEYCNRGSLYDFIEIHKGFCDNMFLVTLECLNESMSYLRRKSLIHRDIKPGNMMVHMDSMGYYIVKLGDMGAAKKVANDQMFQTLVGTEEYLHPDMYIRYLDNLDNEHSAGVDLWSIGVTLYHASVNELPFLPYNYGRANANSKDVLKYMYNTMPDRVIGGRQTTPNKNDINWIYKLPDKCRLSPMLKDLVAELLAELFNRKETAEKAFDNFFSLAKRILSKKRILVFTPNDEKLQFLYLNDLYYETIMTEAGNILGSSRDSLILLTKCKLLKSTPGYEVVKSFPVKGHLRYKLTDDTVFIIPSNIPTDVANKTSAQRYIDIDEPLEKYKSHKERVSYSANIMKIMYEIDRDSDYVICQFECFEAVMDSYNSNLMINTVKNMYDTLPWQMKLIRTDCKMMESILDIYKKLQTHFPNITEHEDIQKLVREIEELKKKADEGENCGNQYYKKICDNREMLKFTEKEIVRYTKITKLGNIRDHLDHLLHLAEEIMNEIRIIPDDKLKSNEDHRIQIWRRHKQQAKYFNEAKQHIAEQYERVKQIQKSYGLWLKQALNVMNRISSLRDFLRRQEDRRMNIRTKIPQVLSHITVLMDKLSSNDSSFSPSYTDLDKLKQVAIDTERIKNILLYGENEDN